MAKNQKKGSKRPQKKQVNAADMQKQTEEQIPKGEKFEFNLKNKKFRAVIPFVLMALLFVAIWATENPKVTDPWYAAAQLVDSSRKVEDPELKKKLLEKGGSELRRLVEKHPYHARVHFLLGFYYLNAQKHDSAMAEFKVAINKGKGGLVNQVEFQAADLLATAALQKSVKQFQSGKQKQARYTLLDAAEYQTRSPQLFSQLGIYYHQSQMLDSARRYYRKALKLNPKIQPARNNYANMEFYFGNQNLRKNKIQKAIEHYKTAFQYGNENADLMNKIGQNLMAKNQPQMAANFFRQAVKVKPNFAQAKKNLRIAQQMSGGQQ
jgi:Tfp pilus assembly protein PilF